MEDNTILLAPSISKEGIMQVSCDVMYCDHNKGMSCMKEGITLLGTGVVVEDGQHTLMCQDYTVGGISNAIQGQGEGRQAESEQETD